MKIADNPMTGLFLLEPLVHADDRGYFMESYRDDFIQSLIPGIKFIQDNESRSAMGVVRGMHYQIPPFEQTKLVRVIEGKAYDYVIDLRKNSHTYLNTYFTELSGENKRQLLIPPGFAHGFLTLSEYALFFYKVDKIYSKNHERGILFSDPALPFCKEVDLQNLQLSGKDALLPLLKDMENPF